MRKKQCFSILFHVPPVQIEADAQLYDRSEKPDAIIDFPVSVTDYEAVDIFKWQEEAAGMLSQMEFVRRVDVQKDTVEAKIKDGTLLPDMVVPF